MTNEDGIEPLWRDLSVELLKLQAHLRATRGRLAILFEGRDTAGKGGAIFHFTRFLNPKLYRVVALSKPTELEAGQWYFQRYIARLPNAGETVFFDRSWYNRAVVEPVMGFCTPEQYERFMRQVVELERMLVEDGLTIIKLWFSIDPEEQRRRLASRETDPLKKWKLSTVDMEAQRHWDDFTRHKLEMFRRTHSEHCPWTIVQGNDKRLARIESIRSVLERLDYEGKDAAVLARDKVEGIVARHDPGC